MNPLHTLRHAHRLWRGVLVWFVLSLGAAIASPLVNPQTMELICTGAGVMKLLVNSNDGLNDGGGAEAGSSMLDCPLCASVAAPPPLAQTTRDPAQPLGSAVQSIPATRAVGRAAAPLPARGPPAFS